MATDKTKRQRQLDSNRKRLLLQLRTELESLCESHEQRNVTKMHDTVDRMLQTLTQLRDTKTNHNKRKTVLAHLTDAISSASVDPVVSLPDNNNCVFVKADLSLDKLVESLVWLRADEEIEMVELSEYVDPIPH